MNGKYTVCALFVCCFLRSTLATIIHDEFDVMIKRMDIMEQENVRLVTRMTQMERENEHLTSRVHDLEEDKKQQCVLDSQLLTENQKMWDAIKKQESRFLNLMPNKTVPDGNKRRRSFPEVPYAFTAVLGHNVFHAGIDQTVIFDSVLLNDGNAYNKKTGIFTVPTDGVYLFYLAFASGYEPHKVWMHIVVDGVGKVAGVADTLQPNHDAQGTNLVMLHLHHGDSVWVSTFRVPDVTVYGVTKLTTFSGILLYQN